MPFSKNWWLRKQQKLLRPLTDSLDKNLMLSGKILSYKTTELEKIEDLTQVEFSIFSQWGEDGIINWLVDKVSDLPQSFIEFGVEDYREANTRYLLKSRNWRGLIIDGDFSNIERIRNDEMYWRYDLTAVESFITTENINNTFENNNFTGDIGLLSIDIDGNDYWVWEAITTVNPILVVIEYNSIFGNNHKLAVPYKPQFVRNEEHSSNLYFGASIKALNSLAEKKGYKFLGTNSNGLNAFYIRETHAFKLENKIDKICIYPSKFREGRNPKGDLTYLKASERLSQIDQCRVVDLSTSSPQPVKLSDFEDLYSGGWHNGQRQIL